MSDSRKQIAERWLTIDSFPRYEISNFGRIRNTESGLIRKSVRRRLTGYHWISLYRTGVKKNVSVHGLVLTVFCGPRPDGYQAGHLDGNRSNNAIWNLKWVTPLENSRHQILHGTRPRLEWHPLHKLTLAAVEEIRRVGRGHSRQLATRFGVNPCTIQRVVNGETWTDFRERKEAR